MQFSTTLFVSLLLFFSTTINAQIGSEAMASIDFSSIEKTTSKDHKKEVTKTTAFKPLAELKASFEGGQMALSTYLQSKLDYPEMAQKYNIEGLVIVRFRILPDGSLEQFYIKKSLHQVCDKKVLKALKKMPSWIPAQQGTRKVATWCEVAVNFKLQ